MIVDWVYHDKDGNPHIHLMMPLRALTEDGFGRKKVPVLGADGKPLRVVTRDRPNGQIVYRIWAGDRETMKTWKIAWAETANRHLALAGHARDFARRRGIDTLSGIAAGMEERVARRLTWLAEKRRQVAKLWERASVALGIAIKREKSVSYSEKRSKTVVAEVLAERTYLIPPTTRFARSIEQDARRAQLTSDRWREREAILRPVLGKIYRDPVSALTRLNTLASDAGVEPRRLGDDLATRPQRLGRLRGSDLLIDGRLARDERKAALGALAELVPLARAHAMEFRRQAERFGIREEQRRGHMALSVPALSKSAMARLVEIEAVRESGGPDAYKTAFAYAVEDRLLVQEVKAVNEALTARFGWSAFTEKADAIAERNMVERMPDDLVSERREKLARLFVVVRRFAEEQHLAERKDRSKVVAGASVEPGKETSAVLPMLAAVTEFKASVEDEARGRACDVARYGHNRAALVETAARIWRDPAGAVDRIEALILKGFAGERIAVAVANNPAAYGALRGSDRIMDRLLAVGRERKDALQAVPEAESRVRSLGAAYTAALDSETKAIGEERRRMAIAIPGMSPPAEDALRELAAAMKRKGAKLDVVAGSLEPATLQEFARVSRALDLRFGRDAILRGEKNAINSVSPGQRRAFETMQDRLKVLQKAVRMGSAQQIATERQYRAIGRGVIR